MFGQMIPSGSITYVLRLVGSGRDLSIVAWFSILSFKGSWAQLQHNLILYEFEITPFTSFPGDTPNGKKSADEEQIFGQQCNHLFRRDRPVNPFILFWQMPQLCQ